MFQVIPILSDSDDQQKEKDGLEDGLEFIKTAFSSSSGLSYQVMKRDGKIKIFVDGEVSKEQLQRVFLKDLGACRIKEIESNDVSFFEGEVHVFTIESEDCNALNLELFPDHLRNLFQLMGPEEQLLYRLSIERTFDHPFSSSQEEEKKVEDVPKQKQKRSLKEGMKKTSQWLWENLTTDQEKESILKKIRPIQEGYKSIKESFFQKKEKEQIIEIQPEEIPQDSGLPVFTRRKSRAQTFASVKVMFFLRTSRSEKKHQFRQALEEWAEMLQGDTKLLVKELQTDLANSPSLCLYRKELLPILWIPSPLEKGVYHERKSKTEIPSLMLTNELGSLPFARRMDTEELISIPRPKTPNDWDDWVKVTLLTGGMGGGKSTFLVNQILETFCVRAKNREEWRKHAKSVVAFDVADGKIFAKILSHIPDWLQDRVIILNHADFDHPIPVNFHDLLELNKRTLNISGYESEIAEIETQILLDSIKDTSSTNSIERYLINAFHASLLAGEGNILDAVRILRNPSYRKKIFNMIDDDHIEVKTELIEFENDLQEKSGATLRTIENRFAKIKLQTALLDCIGQKKHPEIDFWKWTNGDKEGPYLVLVHIPSSMPKLTYNYLFAHYFVKLWKLMKLRDSIEEEKRNPVLVVVDEIHQIMNHRSVVDILVPLFKEPRKYRYRYLITMHGFSSIQNHAIESSLEDNAPNLVLFKGGDDIFKKLGRMFSPYDLSDYHQLAKLRYCALFKVSAGQKDRIFIAKLMEPPEYRFPVYQEVTLNDFRKAKNKFGRPRRWVQQERKKMLSEIYRIHHQKGEIVCQPQRKRLAETTIDVRV